MKPHMIVTTDFRKGSKSLSLEALSECAEHIKAQALPPYTVSTPDEAEALIKQDILGRHWEVGDSYYVLQDMFEGATPLKVFEAKK